MGDANSDARIVTLVASDKQNNCKHMYSLAAFDLLYGAYPVPARTDKVYGIYIKPSNWTFFVSSRHAWELRVNAYSVSQGHSVRHSVETSQFSSGLQAAWAL
jgi:hypothetical protein